MGGERENGSGGGRNGKGREGDGKRERTGLEG